MRNLVIYALLLASAFQTALGEQSGDWSYWVYNDQATISGYTGDGAGGALTIPYEINGKSVTRIGGSAFRYHEGLTSITIPNSVTSIEDGAFYGCTSLASITIPNSVTSIGERAFAECYGLTSITIPNSVTSIGNEAFIYSNLSSITAPFWLNPGTLGISVRAQVIKDYLLLSQRHDFVEALAANNTFINAVATNDAFVTAVANKIKSTGGNYGLATQSGVSSAIEPLATKTQITTAINEGKASGIASVTASPNTWSLFTASQIQNMAIGDLVLNRQVNGSFVLNYDIEQSTDLQTWTTYAPLSLPLTGLPTDKAFVRIKVRQDGVTNPSSSQTTPTTPTFGSSYDGSSGVSAPGGLNPPNYNGLPSGISPDWLNSLPTGPVGPIEEE